MSEYIFVTNIFEYSNIRIYSSHSVLDHNDPSKPSHRLTNGPEPSKTIESDGSKINNHWKTIDGNGQTAKKHSMVMVSSKTIENLQWSLQTIEIFNGFLKTIELVNGLLKSIFSKKNGIILWSQLQSWFGSFVLKSKFLIFIAFANPTCLIPLIILDAFIQQPRLLLNHSFKAFFLFPTLQYSWRDDLWTMNIYWIYWKNKYWETFSLF